MSAPAAERRFGLPVALRPLTGIGRRIVHGFWWLLLAAAAITLGANAWLGWQQAEKVSPAFYQLGFSYTVEWGDVSVSALTPELRRAGPVWPAYIVSIDGKPAPDAVAPLAAALRGPPGPVRLAIDDEVSPVRTITVQRSPAIARAAMGSTSPVLFFLLETGVLLAVALVMMACSVLIMRRRGDDPVAQLLAFAFLGGAITVNGSLLRFALDAEWLDSIDGLLFLIPLTVVLAAFPDGRFRSRFAAGVAVAVVPVILLVTLFPSDSGAVESVILLMLLALTILPWLRFRRTPPGIERQQLKWAAFGFAGAAICLLVAGIITAAIALGAFPAAWQFAAGLIGYGVTVSSLVVLAVATTIAILRINLWDADAAIGNSAAIGAVTAILGGVWAACTIVANELAAALLGGDSKALAAGVSAVIAGTVLGPARSRVNKWVDHRFAGDVNAIKALPEQLKLWRASDTRDDVCRRVLDTVSVRLGATRAGVVLWNGEAWVPFAVRGTADKAALADWIARHLATGTEPAEIAAEDSEFPIRLSLNDGPVPVGIFLFGGRPQGAGLSQEMRAALRSLRTPVAAALRHADRFELQGAAILERFKSLEARIAVLSKPGTQGSG